MPLLTEWAARSGVTFACDDDVEVARFLADSRLIQPGDCFVAIRGTAQNGLNYVDAAIAAGAVAVVVQHDDAAIATPVPVISVENIRLAYAKLCAAMYPDAPQHIVAVTGTNGKTSVAEFYRQLWVLVGFEAASIGTLGMTRSAGDIDTLFPANNTSPAPDVLHEHVQRLAHADVQHVAIEASSHGLDQYRLDGVAFEAAAFTNLTQDHLDYHHDMQHYFLAKARLFTGMKLRSNCVIINADDAYGATLMAIARQAGHTLWDYGQAAEICRIEALEPTDAGLRLQVQYDGAQAQIELPLYGAFQAYNVLAAAGLAMAGGMKWEAVLQHAPQLRGVRGRMEYVARHPSGAACFIDYAHTPDALKHLLISLRAHCAKKLHVVFGCGGDRDTTKRAPMGEMATRYADEVIITDDNPRTEDAAAIRQQVLAGAPGAMQIADRAEAIAFSVQQLAAGDILVVAGKGHETYQIIGNQKHAFDDANKIKEAMIAL